MTLARGLLMAAIRGYKRHASPRKGFACAYRIHLGACSCSTLGLRAISRYGAWRGLGVLRLRLRQCHLVAEDLRTRPVLVRAAQGGFVDCDVPCDAPCDLGCGDASAMDGACEAVGCLGCGDGDDCGWWSGSDRTTAAPERRRRRRRGDPVAGEPGPDAPPAEPPAT